VKRKEGQARHGDSWKDHRARQKGKGSRTSVGEEKAKLGKKTSFLIPVEERKSLRVYV